MNEKRLLKSIEKTKKYEIMKKKIEIMCWMKNKKMR